MCHILQSSNVSILPLYRSLSRSPKKHLVFFIGIPGSGKSWWANYFCQAFGKNAVSIVSPDAIRQKLFGAIEIQGSWGRIWQQAVRELRVALGLGKLVIYDATNTRCRYRRQTIACLRAMGFCRIIGVWLDFPLETCLKRNQQRDRQVPEIVIKNMYQDLQLTPPSLADGLDCLQRYILIDGKGIMLRRH